MATVILGPYLWASATEPMQPGQQMVWAAPILTPVPSPGSPPGTTVQQKLQAVNVTVVPAREFNVQALGVSQLSVIALLNGELSVNFVVTNNHATSRCAGYRWWAAVTVNEPAL